MKGRSIAMLLWTAGAALAADDSLRSQLEQRIRMTAKLIADSALSHRIGASGNAAAATHVDEGRIHQSLAEGLLAQGDLAGARREVDDALRHVAIARRLAPDATARQAAVRIRFEQKLMNLKGLLQSWRDRIGPGDVEDGEYLSAVSLVGSAQYLGEQGRHDDALQAIQDAEGHVLRGMNRLLHARTLDYTARATTPSEEFDNELLRHQALADLLPLAAQELKPRDDAMALIDRYSEASQALHSKARRLAQAGDFSRALADIQNASMFLVRALSAAGLHTPAPAGSTP